MLTPVPKGMSPGFYAFMGAGGKRSESGEILMYIPDESEATMTATIPFRNTLPNEVWALRDSHGGLIPTLDDGPYDSFMAFSSQQDAERAAVDQNEKWDCNCEAVMLFKKARRP